MTRASKRAKTTKTEAPDGADWGNVSAKPLIFVPFESGPSLGRIPDDVLHEILSYLPTLCESHALFIYRVTPPVVPSSALVRTPTLRALSQTSRVLRSRCLAMAWQRVELCGASIPKHNVTFYRAIGEATLDGIRVLKACPQLLPLIQTVSVVLTRFRAPEIMPAFAACLAALPNLTTIQVIHAHSQMMTAIKNGFEGKRLSSVRRITLPCSAHEIIKSCPNLEEVTCLDGDGSTIVGSIVKGNCKQVRILRGISASLVRLIKFLPDLKHVGIGPHWDLTPLASFPLLDTIEIVVSDLCGERSVRECAASNIERASKILKENKSQADKTVLVTKWDNDWKINFSEPDANKVNVTKEVIKV